MVKIQKPALRYQEPFLEAVRRSRTLHRGKVSPPNDAQGYQRYISALRRKNCIGFLVLLAETDDLAGVVNVTEIVRGVFQSGYLGYYAFQPHAGRGLMWQGMRHVVRYCFEEQGLHRLEANIQPENKRSIDLVKALGFTKEGYSPAYLRIGGKWRDHERWAIRSEQVP